MSDGQQRVSLRGQAAATAGPAVKLLLVEPLAHTPGYFEEYVRCLSQPLAAGGVDVNLVTFDGLVNNARAAGRGAAHVLRGRRPAAGAGYAGSCRSSYRSGPSGRCAARSWARSAPWPWRCALPGGSASTSYMCPALPCRSCPTRCLPWPRDGGTSSTACGSIPGKRTSRGGGASSGTPYGACSWSGACACWSAWPWPGGRAWRSPTGSIAGP